MEFKLKLTRGKLLLLAFCMINGSALGSSSIVHFAMALALHTMNIRAWEVKFAYKIKHL